MLNVAVEAKGLLKFARYLGDVPKMTNKNLAAALNVAGDNVTRQVIETISLSSGLDRELVRRMIKVKKASEGSLRWTIDVSDVWKPTGPTRQLPKRAFPGTPIAERVTPEQLVKVVTTGDGRVCPICEQIKRGGPYTLTEVRNMSARLNHYGGGLFHPHCRCGTAPFNPTRKLVLDTRKAAAVDSKAVKTMTIKQIAAQIKKQSAIALTVAK